MLLPCYISITTGNHRSACVLQPHLGSVVFSLVFTPGRMVELPGYSLSGVFASFFFILLGMKQSGRMLFFPLLYIPVSQRSSLGADFQIQES